MKLAAWEPPIVQQGWDYGGMKACRECSELLPLEAFYANPNTKDGRLNWCRPCTSKRYAHGRAERARRDRLYFQQIKLERGCTDCGYNANPAALDFDHLPGSEKKYQICVMAGMRRSVIDAEIAKCEVVCANCHRIRTVNRLPELSSYVKADRYRAASQLEEEKR